MILSSHQKLSEGWIDGAPTPGVNTDVKSNRYTREESEKKGEDDDDDDDNPMAVKLRKMRLELRGRLD